MHDKNFDRERTQAEVNGKIDYSNCRVLLFRGKGIISALIRWQTRGNYSHAALLCPDGQIIEAWQGKGVRKTILTSWEGITTLRVKDFTPEQWKKAIFWAEGQIGKKYDYRGVFRFVTRMRPPKDDRMFCSDLVFNAIAEGGLKLLARTEGPMVSPEILSLSPLLIE